MRCPACARRTELRVVREVLVHGCPEGHGLFVRQEELLHLVVAESRSLPVPLPPAPPPKHPCPFCGHALKRRAVGPVELWQCEGCGVIWLERHRWGDLLNLARQFFLLPRISP